MLTYEKNGVRDTGVTTSVAGWIYLTRADGEKVCIGGIYKLVGPEGMERADAVGRDICNRYNAAQDDDR